VQEAPETVPLFLCRDPETAAFVVSNSRKGTEHMGKRKKQEGSLQRGHRNDQRFDQLMELARADDEDALGDLWREYGFDFRQEGGRDTN
jgi:hypothetical protein